MALTEELKIPSSPSLLILSGGMDSGVLLALLHSKGVPASTISFNYGSKHADKELDSAVALATHYQVENRVIDISSIAESLNSSLLKSGDQIPLGSYDQNNMASTVVPFRNGIFASIASGVAESMSMDNILIGTHGGDHRVYPDCRPEFNRALAQSIFYGSDKKVRFFAPFENFSKKDIANLGLDLDFPFEKSWTCYQGRDLHCGQCAACIERRDALGHRDPTSYETPLLEISNQG